MGDANSIVVVLLCVFIFISASFTLVKAVFAAIYAKRDSRDRTDREEKIAKIVETGGYNETVSIGRIFSDVGIGVFGYCLFMNAPWQWIHDYWLLGLLAYMVCASAVIYVVTIFCPNIIGILKPDTLSVILVPLYRLIRMPFVPVGKVCHVLYVKTLNALGYDAKLSFLPEERRDAVQADLSDSSLSEEGLEKEERQMILNIFDFVETPVREIMTPRVDMCAIDVDTSLEDLVKVLNNERHSRLPVYKDTVDNIVGILSNRDFLEWFTEHHDEPFDLMKIVMPPVYVPYHKKIDDLLTELRKTGNQLAIVVDEYGGTAGLVTLEDILEEIVGEIRDEDDMDEDEDVQKLKDGRYILDPLMKL